MFFLLAPALVLFLIFELLSYLRQQRWGWRASIMMTSLAWGSILVVLTEMLSLIQKLDSLSLALAWGSVLVVLLGALSWLVYQARPQLRNLVPARNEVFRWMSEQDRGIWVRVIKVYLLCDVESLF